MFPLLSRAMGNGIPQSLRGLLRGNGIDEYSTPPFETGDPRDSWQDFDMPAKMG